MTHWFITGCSTGFGRALAEEVLARGHRLSATARRVEALADLAALAPDRVLAVALDVDDEASVAAGLVAANARFGAPDVLVNNAGYGFFGAVEEFSDEEVRRQFETNVFGVMRVLRHSLPLMRANGGGRVLNVSSVAGFRSRAGVALYAASKFALEAIGEGLAGEVAPYGIRVTNVEPGLFRTDFAGRSLQRAARKLDAYDATAGEVSRWAAEITGTQPGDPRKAARAMIEVAEMADPPLRLPLGKDAVAGIRAKLDAVREDVDRMEALSTSTDFDEVL